MAREHRLPTSQDINELPRWARVAFAVRCAQRVRPLVRSENARYADEAIWLASRAARDPEDITRELIEAALDTAADAVYDREDLVRDGAYDLAAYAARLAANAAYDAPFVGIDISAFADSAGTIATAVWKDHFALLALSAKHDWSDGTPVDPDALGPLWPDGEPEGWPKSPPPPFKLTIDPGDATTEEIQELLAAISELHETHTGYALTYRTDGTLIRAGEEVRV